MSFCDMCNICKFNQNIHILGPKSCKGEALMLKHYHDINLAVVAQTHGWRIYTFEF